MGVQNGLNYIHRIILFSLLGDSWSVWNRDIRQKLVKF